VSRVRSGLCAPSCVSGSSSVFEFRSWSVRCSSCAVRSVTVRVERSCSSHFSSVSVSVRCSSFQFVSFQFRCQFVVSSFQFVSVRFRSFRFSFGVSSLSVRFSSFEFGSFQFGLSSCDRVRAVVSVRCACDEAVSVRFVSVSVSVCCQVVSVRFVSLRQGRAGQGPGLLVG
jgi:hypothetical protein